VYDPGAFATRVRATVVEVVRQQVESRWTLSAMGTEQVRLLLVRERTPDRFRVQVTPI
jgi:hypothetical protein